jgi:hypothetical protein
MRKFSSSLLFYWLPTVFILGPALARASSNQGVILGQYVVDSENISKSLLFDQEFDTKVVRPLQDHLAEAVIAPVVVKPSVASFAEPVPHVEPVAAPVAVPIAEAPVAARGSLEFSGIATPKKDPNSRLADEATFDFSSLWAAPKVEAMVEPVRVSSLQSKVLGKTLEPSALVLEPILGSLAISKPDGINVPSVKDLAHSTPVVKSAPKPKDNTVVSMNSSVDLPKNLYRKGPMELVLIDEESFLEARPTVVRDAMVFWGHPSLLLSSKSNSSGRVLPLNKNFASARFVVQADGYLPAVGYAASDMITPVILIKEKRLGPVLKSLGVNPVAGRSIVWGKVLSSSLEARADVKVDSSDSKSKTYYSTGSFGLFHPKVKHSGSQGDFLISGLGHQLHYLLPTEEKSFGNMHELPPALINLEGLGSVVTTTIVDGLQSKIETQVVDGMSLERPETGIFATVGGMRGLETADDEGFMKFSELPLRNQVDLVEVRANGYLKTWINSPARRGTFPELVSLFNRTQMNELLEGSGIALRQNDAVVLGQLRPEIYRRNYHVEIFNSQGSAPADYRVVYFDIKNRPNPNQTSTDRTMQTFALLQVPNGEYHLAIRDSETKELISMQVIRVSDGVVTQVQF